MMYHVLYFNNKVYVLFVFLAYILSRLNWLFTYASFYTPIYASRKILNSHDYKTFKTTKLGSVLPL